MQFETPEPFPSSAILPAKMRQSSPIFGERAVLEMDVFRRSSGLIQRIEQFLGVGKVRTSLPDGFTLH